MSASLLVACRAETPDEDGDSLGSETSASATTSASETSESTTSAITSENETSESTSESTSEGTTTSESDTTSESGDEGEGPCEPALAGTAGCQCAAGSCEGELICADDWCVDSLPSCGSLDWSIETQLQITYAADVLEYTATCETSTIAEGPGWSIVLDGCVGDLVSMSLALSPAGLMPALDGATAIVTGYATPGLNEHVHVAFEGLDTELYFAWSESGLWPANPDAVPVAMPMGLVDVGCEVQDDKCGLSQSKALAIDGTAIFTTRYAVLPSGGQAWVEAVYTCSGAEHVDVVYLGPPAN